MLGCHFFLAFWASRGRGGICEANTIKQHYCSPELPTPPQFPSPAPHGSRLPTCREAQGPPSGKPRQMLLLIRGLQSSRGRSSILETHWDPQIPVSPTPQPEKEKDAWEPPSEKSRMKPMFLEAFIPQESEAEYAKRKHSIAPPPPPTPSSPPKERPGSHQSTNPRMRPLLLDASGHQEVEVKDTKRQ